MAEEKLSPRSVAEMMADHAKHLERLAQQVYVEDGFIVLNFDGKYEIALDRCSTPTQLLEWVAHLCEKVWVTPQILRAFMLLAAEKGNFSIYRDA